MRKIYKYELDFNHEMLATVLIHAGAEILSIQVRDDKICLWAEIETNNQTECKTIKAYRTGWDIEDDPSFRQYLGTVQYNDLVWHLFEMIERPVEAETRHDCDHCSNPGRELHSCPYDEELHDGTVQCNCCENCTEQCAMDI